MTELHPTRLAMTAAIHAEFDRIEPEIRRQLAERALHERIYTIPEIINIQIAQNVLRDCMTAVMEKLVPFTELTNAELAIRLASYAISAAPANQQTRLAEGVAEVLVEAHQKRIAQGVSMSATWKDPD